MAAILSAICHLGLAYFNPRIWVEKNAPEADSISVELIKEESEPQNLKRKTDSVQLEKTTNSANAQNIKKKSFPDANKPKETNKNNPGLARQKIPIPTTELQNKEKTPLPEQMSTREETMDLALIQNVPTTPDPSKGEMEEATITLGETDERYQGYLEKIRGAINDSWDNGWREALLAAGRNGKVVVLMNIAPEGHIINIIVTESSGSDILDEAAAAAVKKAPIPPFPEHWTLQRLNLFAQFEYNFE